MDNNTANPLTTSDAVSIETEDYYDFRSKLKLAVEIKWAKTHTNILEKKKTKRKKGKAAKKHATSSSWKFQSVNLLHECLLEDQEIVDKESEMLKFNKKNKIDEFMDGHEEIMKETGHCNNQDKLDGSMKAHCRRVFMKFDTVTHGKSKKNYFDIEQ